MKNLKTVIILIVVLLLTQVVVAQSRTTYIIKGGISSASLIIKDDDHTYFDTGDSRLGFRIGVSMETPVIDILNFETGVFLSRKGMKWEKHGVTRELTPMYLEIPLNLKYSKPVNNLSLYGTVGAYVGYGFAGETNASGSILSYSDDISWGSDEDDDMKPFDLGGTIGFGVIVDQIEAGLYGSTSFINLAPDTSNGYSIRNVELGLTVGYRFKMPN
ncbi:MAG: porin family protein [Candidatus Cloacimonadales bacterium]